ncbi:MAG: hypothetical protein GX621_13315 [Pirellulaceae bacterium]|nr:hypothetical protein [Pirellulaceae bacterium]
MKNMTRRKQLKLDKKKRKKKEELREANRTTDLVYSGTKYRKAQYVPIFVATETAILEVFVMSKRHVTDDDAYNAIITLIERLRAGGLSPIVDSSREEPQEALDSEEFMVWNIVRHWKHLFEQRGPVSRDVLVGVLRTTLHSITVWGSPSPASRGYLGFLEGSSPISAAARSQRE